MRYKTAKGNKIIDCAQHKIFQRMIRDKTRFFSSLKGADLENGIKRIRSHFTNDEDDKRSHFTFNGRSNSPHPYSYILHS